MGLGKTERIRVNKLFDDVDEALSLEIRNWEDDYRVDMIMDNGFDITEPATRKVKGGKGSSYEKNKYGAHSRIFGSDFNDEDGYSELYRCQCGKYKGNKFEGEICDECGTKVEYIGVNMKMTGWISLTNGHYFIHPMCYNILTTLFPKNEFYEIVRYDMDIDINGNIIQKENKNAFYGIGVSSFRERFYEIMMYQRKQNKRNKKKIRTINKLMELKASGILFQKRIPVFSAMLRDSRISNEQFQFHTIDKKINMIFSQAALLNGWRDNKKSLPNELALSELQKHLMQYWNLVCNDIDGKEGLIKYGIMGGRVNWSARDVIVPDPTLEANQVRVGYILFLELFKFEIIQMLVRMKDITYNDAFEQWSFATTHFDESIWKLMNHYISKTKPKILLNRNPSINYGSLTIFNILSVERGYQDNMVLYIPIPVLTKFNADFDGDRMNVQSIKIRSHQKEFEKFLDPRKAMQISRLDGKYDKDLFLIKDQLVGLHLFNSI